MFWDILKFSYLRPTSLYKSTGVSLYREYRYTEDRQTGVLLYDLQGSCRDGLGEFSNTGTSCEYNVFGAKRVNICSPGITNYDLTCE